MSPKAYLVITYLIYYQMGQLFVCIFRFLDLEYLQTNTTILRKQQPKQIKKTENLTEKHL